MGNSKDTVYVDIDDEITTIIDKVHASDGRFVALVLPKRATVFQSIVNMKLLKRSAEAAKKHVVLVTTESSLMPLAGAVGLHVAPTPQSKPEVPTTSDTETDTDEDVEEPLDDGADEAYTSETAGHRTVGELAGATASVATSEKIETLSLPDESDETDQPPDTATAKKPPKDKHLKVPNFNRFRARLFIGVFLLAGLIVGLYVCLAVLPKATITITTDASDINVNLTATLDTAAQKLDAAHMVVPAKIEQQQKTTTQQVATTGQKNNGTAATGSVTMSAGSCSGSAPGDIPAGTGISTNGLTFITQGNTSFVPVLKGGKCTWQGGPTGIAAQNPGSKYNVDSATFSVAGRSDTSATGSASGGTDNVIQIVAQADIDSGKQKLATQDTAAVKSALEQALRQDGLYPLSATFNAGTPTITTSANVGDQASNVTVTQAVTYTMYGAKKSDLLTLVQGNVSNQIDTKNQSILDDGLDNATINVVNAGATSTQVSIQATATVGPDINAEDIKKQSEGKKIGDVKALVNNIQGVTNVDVHLSPFWVGSVPTNPSKITVTIEKAKQSSHGNG